MSAGAQALGFGGEFGDIILGSARSIDRFTPAIGFGSLGAGIIGSIGASTVTDIRKEKCSCE